ncbi:MAG: secretin N-terminal domain-containing protein, partial [Candidatus Poseidoniia archaeon]
SNSMRTMLIDANTQQLLPAGNTNSMVITAFGDFAADLARTLKEIDALAGAQHKVSLEVIMLEHTQAGDVRARLQELLAPPASSPGMRGSQGHVSSTTKITVDPRTNSLLIQARDLDMPDIKEMIARLDIPTRQDVVDGEDSDD